MWKLSRKPDMNSMWIHCIGLLQSESMAWAVQNALGVLFTILFSIVWPMHFTLSCVSSALFAAASQVLSIDRSVGGRLFSASLFVGCMMSGGIIGGAISSLAWLARGESQGIAIYLSEGFDELSRIANVTIGEVESLGIVSQSPLLQGILANGSSAVRELESQQLIQLVGDAIKLADTGVVDQIFASEPEFLREAEFALYNEAGSAIPVIKDGYWVLLIVLFTVMCIPFAIARAHENFKIGLLMAISTLFMGSQVIFACLTPILGIRDYWTQIVTGYIKVALVNGAAMVVTALLVYVRSSYDDTRSHLGSSFQTCGLILSRIASSIHQIEVGGSSTSSAGVYAASCKTLRTEALIMAEDTVETIQRGGKENACEYGDDENKGSRPEPPPLITSFALRSSCQVIEDSLAVSLFELPLPGVASQVGARRADFAELLKSLRTLLSTVCCIETIHVGAASELSKDHDLSPVKFCLASVTSVVQELGSVLGTMPLFGPCKGKELSWRPREPSFWADLETSMNNQAFIIEEYAIKQNIKVSERGRDMMLLIMNCKTLLSNARLCESLVCKALDVPTAKDSVKVVEEIKNAQESKPTLKDKIAGNAYFPGIIVHAVLLSGIAQYVLVILSTAKFFKGLVSCIRSKTERMRLIRDPNVQFALKFWLATSLTVMSVVLILWKAKFSSPNQLQNAYDLTYFFFVWQPIYFWLTVAICVQFQVEAAVMRAVLRTTMTAIGGTLGYCAMLNGSLAQNPYWICGVTVLVNGFFSLFSPLKSLRYSIFLANFTFNAVVVCQYYGCPPCDLPGEANIYGGKVLSTMFGSIYAILVSWCILPFYTSQKMMAIEYDVMRDGLSMMKSTWQQVNLRHDSKVSQSSDEFHDLPLLDTESVDKLVDERLTAVHKEVENNTIAKDQLVLIAWTILPTPKVVYLMMKRLERLGVFLREYAQVRPTNASSGDLPPSENFVDFAERIDGLLLDCFEKAQKVLTNCKENFDSITRADLDVSRSNICSSVAALEESLDAVTESFIEWDHGRTKHQTWRKCELLSVAKSRLLTLAMKEIFVIGVLLGETEGTLDRDWYMSAWSSWFGRRPVV
jgi:hypothetical protein